MAKDVVIKDLTNNSLVRDIRRAAALAGSLSGRPAAFTASGSYLIIINVEQVDTKND